MSVEQNVQIVKDFFAAMGRGDKQRLLALTAKDIEWIVPGENWPLAGTHRGHAGLAELLRKASDTIELSYPAPPEFVAQETGFWSSVSLGGKSKPRIGRSRTTLSSPLLFEMAN
jgi:ketosteroid isomerase-like protein